MLKEPLHIGNSETEKYEYRIGHDDDSEEQQQLRGEVYLMDVYKFKQRYGYCSIIFSFVQTCVLIAMMAQCGVAPMRINPMIGPYPDALSYWGAKNAVLIIEDGEWWRLQSPILLHAGVLHLVGNVGVQIETGVFFEKEWGSPIWLAVYYQVRWDHRYLAHALWPIGYQLAHLVPLWDYLVRSLVKSSAVRASLG